MKKTLLTLAVACAALLATAQTNQYFWYNGMLMFGVPITQTDSITFSTDVVAFDTLLLPRIITKVIHDTVYINNCNCDQEDTKQDGALSGLFSVSPTKKVRFSKGNLQYNAAQGTHQCADGTIHQGTWRFAENQWDFVGENNSNISSTYNGWIDLFGWGTSGYNGCNPWKSDTDLMTYGNTQRNGNEWLDIEDTYYDWGKYVEISNSEYNYQWRLLTKDEIYYLQNDRPNAAQLEGAATVNNVKGLILLPDDWKPTQNISFNSSDVSSNVYSLTEWKQMESAGAVFLPLAGYRNEASYYCCSNERQWGQYWTATIYPPTHGSVLIFSMFEKETQYSFVCDMQRCNGYSVRLVIDSTK